MNFLTVYLYIYNFILIQTNYSYSAPLSKILWFFAKTSSFHSYPTFLVWGITNGLNDCEVIMLKVIRRVSPQTVYSVLFGKMIHEPLSNDMERIVVTNKNDNVKLIQFTISHLLLQPLKSLFITHSFPSIIFNFFLIPELRRLCLDIQTQKIDVIKRPFGIQPLGRGTL